MVLFVGLGGALVGYRQPINTGAVMLLFCLRHSRRRQCPDGLCRAHARVVPSPGALGLRRNRVGHHVHVGVAVLPTGLLHLVPPHLGPIMDPLKCARRDTRRFVVIPAWARPRAAATGSTSPEACCALWERCAQPPHEAEAPRAPAHASTVRQRRRGLDRGSQGVPTIHARNNLVPLACGAARRPEASGLFLGDSGLHFPHAWLSQRDERMCGRCRHAPQAETHREALPAEADLRAPGSRFGGTTSVGPPRC
eukprot:scaffold2342_cov368-Pinguiococcus_pyrenoidosus.AAC.13